MQQTQYSMPNELNLDSWPFQEEGNEENSSFSANLLSMVAHDDLVISATNNLDW